MRVGRRWRIIGGLAFTAFYLYFAYRTLVVVIHDASWHLFEGILVTVGLAIVAGIIIVYWWQLLFSSRRRQSKQ
jgi:hypothetical protein